MYCQGCLTSRNRLLTDVGNWPAERTKDLGVEKEWVTRKIRQKNVAPLKRVVLLSALYSSPRFITITRFSRCPRRAGGVRNTSTQTDTSGLNWTIGAAHCLCSDLDPQLLLSRATTVRIVPRGWYDSRALLRAIFRREHLQKKKSKSSP